MSMFINILMVIWVFFGGPVLPPESRALPNIAPIQASVFAVPAENKPKSTQAETSAVALTNEPPQATSPPQAAVASQNEPIKMIIITQNTMPVNKPEPVLVGKTLDGWDIYNGTGYYAVDPETGDHYSVMKKNTPQGVVYEKTGMLVWKAPK